jgi:hypothetical protein
MSAVVPTLSPVGWARSPEDKAFFLFSHFYESEKNQTRVYGNNVSNLQWLNAEYGTDIPEFCAQLRKTLTDYLGRHFDSVNVDVTSDMNTNPGSQINIKVSSSVFENGIKYSFGHLVQQNGKVVKLLTLINGSYQ